MPSSHSKFGKLLYQGSRDGFNADAFRDKAGGKGSTVVLVKTQSITGREIIGGFAEPSWPSEIHESTWELPNGAVITEIANYVTGDAKSFIFMHRNGVLLKFPCSEPFSELTMNGLELFGFGSTDFTVYDDNKTLWWNTDEDLCDGYGPKPQLEYTPVMTQGQYTEIEVYEVLR